LWPVLVYCQAFTRVSVAVHIKPQSRESWGEVLKPSYTLYEKGLLTT
jgi:hypothetical protein